MYGRIVYNAPRASEELLKGFEDVIAGAAYGLWPVIPRPIDQNPRAQVRRPIDLTRQGWSMSSFQASQQWATISS